jgi:hypothetical protein
VDWDSCNSVTRERFETRPSTPSCCRSEPGFFLDGAEGGLKKRVKRASDQA